MDHAEVVDADGEPVDLSLPQPTGADSDGPAAVPPAEASAPPDQEAQEPELPEEEPAQ